jgi:hypothetical protein
MEAVRMKRVAGKTSSLGGQAARCGDDERLVQSRLFRRPAQGGYAEGMIAGLREFLISGANGQERQSARHLVKVANQSSSKSRLENYLESVISNM